MSDQNIRQALEMHLAAMAAPLPTLWENKDPPATFDAAAPYQKAFVLRAPNQGLGMREKTTRARGVFQVSLCYPCGNGTFKIETQARALQLHFAAGLILERGGVKIKIRGMPSIGAPISTSPYVVPVSIRFDSIY